MIQWTINVLKLFQVSQKTLHKYEQESRKVGKQSFVYAWVLDETGEERNRGITMDVGRSQFETKTKLVSNHYLHTQMGGYVYYFLIFIP